MSTDNVEQLDIPTFLDRHAELSADAGSGMTNDRGGTTGAVKPAPSWRDDLPVHPAAELLPPMSEGLRELGEDIKANGLQSPIVVNQEGRGDDVNVKFSLLDGRNRLDAMAAAGIDFKIQRRKHRHGWIDLYLEFSEDPYDDYDVIKTVSLDEAEALNFVISANLHRRHLTGEQKRDLIAKVLKANPEASNRQIAKQTKADHKTVAAVRDDLESGGEIPHVETRTDSKGRKQPATKAKAAKPEPVNHRVTTSPETSIEQRRAENARLDDDGEVTKDTIAERECSICGGHCSPDRCSKQIELPLTADCGGKLPVREIAKLDDLPTEEEAEESWQIPSMSASGANGGCNPAKVLCPSGGRWRHRRAMSVAHGGNEQRTARTVLRQVHRTVSGESASAPMSRAIYQFAPSSHTFSAMSAVMSAIYRSS